MTYNFTLPEYAALDQAVNDQRWEYIDRTIDTWGVPRGTELVNQRFGTQFSQGDVKALCDRYQATRRFVWANVR